MLLACTISLFYATSVYYHLPARISKSPKGIVYARVPRVPTRVHEQIEKQLLNLVSGNVVWWHGILRYG